MLLAATRYLWRGGSVLWVSLPTHEQPANKHRHSPQSCHSTRLPGAVMPSVSIFNSAPRDVRRGAPMRKAQVSLCL
jgi:hypothetical protein